jgi:hypothetical protein
MVDLPQYPPLKPLHPDSSLNVGKRTQMDRLSTEPPAFLTGSGRARLPENSAGWNYTGGT